MFFKHEPNMNLCLYKHKSHMFLGGGGSKYNCRLMWVLVFLSQA